MSREIWKWAIFYEDGSKISFKGFYKVSNLGNIWCSGFSYTQSVKQNYSGKVITKNLTYRRKKGSVKPFQSQGYPALRLSIGMGSLRVFVHRLVLDTFSGPCPEGMECRHLNDVKTDNRWPENLAWGTHEENHWDAVKNGSYNGRKGKPGVQRFGESNPNYKHGRRCQK